MNEKISPASPGSYRWLVFTLMAIGYLLVNFHRLCPAVVAVDLMNDLKAGGSLMGILASAYFYPYALMQIPSGLLSDSWGPRKTIVSSFLLAGLASIALGFAETSGAAIAARILVGVGVSLFFVPIMKIVTHWFTAAEFSFMTGLIIATGGLGALSAAYPLAFLSSHIGWRGSFMSIGVVTLLTAGAIWVLVRNTPEELGYSAVDREKPGTDSHSQAMPLWDGVKHVLASRRFYPLASWYFFTFGVFYCFAGLWGGPYLIEVYGLSKAESGTVLSMFAVAIIAGSPLFSLLSDRVFHSRKKVLVISSICLLLLCVPLAFSSGRFTTVPLYVWSFLFGFFGCAISVIGFAAAKESFPVQITGTALGLLNGFPFLGGALMQPLFGYLLDGYGKTASGYPPEAYANACRIFVVSTALAVLSACWIVETFKTGKIRS